MKRWIKRTGIAVAGVVLVIGAAGAGLYGVSSSHFRRSYPIELSNVTVPTDAAAIERGKRLVTVIAKCVECHGANLQGAVMIDDPMFAVLAAPNLTSGKGGVAAQFKTDEDWVRAIRHGVGPDGRALFIMPSREYYYMNDADLGDVIAYIKSLAPVDNVLPQRRIGPIARALITAGKLPVIAADSIDHAAPRPAPVPVGATAAYGEYLAHVGGCTGCHKPTLEGGMDPSGPPDAVWPANLTPAGRLGSWTEADFTRALREGKRPDGTVLDSFMPWRLTAQMSDDEIHALWLYLQTVPPVGGIVVTPHS